MTHDLTTIVPHFDVPGTFQGGEPYGSGHINDTYLVTFSSNGTETPYILQRINHDVFTNPVALMENVERVTEHTRNKLIELGAGHVERRALTLIPSHDGTCYHQDGNGNVWRMYIFITDAQTYDTIETTTQAYEAARAFGRFQELLADLPAPRLHETIPNFHHTRSRFETLKKTIEADPLNRAAQAQPEIAFALEHEPMVDVLLDLQAQGLIQECVTHNDTKLNNVMIDNNTSQGICVIDLDTVMPGFLLYDFGDMVRTATSPAAEDERDLSKIQMRMPMFEALAQGYITAVGDVLTAKERELLPFSGKLLTFECGIRFLADFLVGDTYFKTHRDGHNLDRCRTQFRLIECIEDKEEEMAAFASKV